MGFGPRSLGTSGLPESRDTGSYSAEFPSRLTVSDPEPDPGPTTSTALQTKKRKSLGCLQTQAPESSETLQAAAVHSCGSRPLRV